MNLNILRDLHASVDPTRPWMVDVDETVAINHERRARIAEFSCMSQFDALSISEKQGIMSRASARKDKLTNFGTVFRAFITFYCQVSPVYVSARPTWLYKTTREWLSMYDMSASGVIVRRHHQLPWSSEEFKLHVGKIIKPAVVIDDRPQMKDVARELGAEFLLVPEGWNNERP